MEEADQVREISKTSKTIEVSLRGAWHRVPNNNNSNSIWPALLLTDNNSVYSKSAHGLGDKGVIQLFNEADDTDQASYSTNNYINNASNSNNRPKDQQASQADSSKYTTNDKNDRVN